MIIVCPKCSVKYQVPAEIKLSAGKKMQCSACQHVFEFQPDLSEKPSKEALLPPEDAVLSVSQKTIFVQEKTSFPETKKAVLPEAFQPISAPPSDSASKTLSYVGSFFCICILIVLILVGWFYRDFFLMDAENFNWNRSEIHSSVKRPYRKKHPKIPSLKKEKPLTQTVSEKAIVSDIPVMMEDEVPLDEPQLQSQLLPTIQSVRFRIASSSAGDSVLIEGALKNTSDQTLPLPEKVYAMAYGTDGTILFEKEIYLPNAVINPGEEQSFFGTYAPAMKGIQWVDVVLEK